MTSLPSAQSEPQHSHDTHLDEWWLDGALRAIAALVETDRIFSCDDLRAEPYAIPEPCHPSHWGALFAKARTDGIIRQVGFIASRTGSRNGGVLRTWRRAQRTAVPAA